jgi:hypothetical protein
MLKALDVHDRTSTQYFVGEDELFIMYNQMASKIWSMDQNSRDLMGDRGHPEANFEKRLCELVKKTGDRPGYTKWAL